MPVRDHSWRYGAGHKQLRRVLLLAYQPGDLCGLCGEAMLDTPELLDLAHAESGRGYAGLAHRRCNRGEGQAASNRARVDKGDPRGRAVTRW